MTVLHAFPDDEEALVGVVATPLPRFDGRPPSSGFDRAIDALMFDSAYLPKARHLDEGLADEIEEVRQ